MEMWLERLLNNNEADFFYLHQEPAQGLPVSSCAILALPISLKSEPHYDKCQRARILSLKEGFRAKLGSLTGQLYSRVGTEDWPPAQRTEWIRTLLADAAIWVDEKKKKKLTTALSAWHNSHPGENLAKAQFEEIEAKIKTKKEDVIERLFEIVQSSDYLKDGKLTKLRNSVRNDARLSQLLKE